MSGRDTNAKKITAADVRRSCDIRARASAISKPTEKAAEHFRRKAYENGKKSYKETNAHGK